jgi:hypothetical protein
VATPAAFLGGGNGQALGNACEQSVEQGQGKAVAGQAVRLAGAVDVGQPRHLRTGGVAVEDLQYEQVDGGDGIEDPFTPLVAEVVAELADGLGRQPLSDSDSDLDSCDGVGSASANPALAKVAQLLEEAPEGLTRTELMNALQRHVPANRLTDHLQQLLQHRLARSESTPTRGRPAERWFACEPSQAMTATLECALTTLGRSIPEHRPVSTPIQRWPSP